MLTSLRGKPGESEGNQRHPDARRVEASPAAYEIEEWPRGEGFRVERPRPKTLVWTYESREIATLSGVKMCTQRHAQELTVESISNECILDCRISAARRPRGGEDHPLRFKRESRSVS